MAALPTHPGADVHDWRDRAACLEEDPESFFPSPTDIAAHNAAKEVCSLCPVLGECAEWAFRVRDQEAIAGGMTVGERRSAWRRGTVAAVVAAAYARAAGL